MSAGAGAGPFPVVSRMLEGRATHHGCRNTLRGWSKQLPTTACVRACVCFQVSVELMIELCQEHRHRFCAAQRALIDSLMVFVKAQRVIRKQGPSMKEVGLPRQKQGFRILGPSQAVGSGFVWFVRAVVQGACWFQDQDLGLRWEVTAQLALEQVTHSESNAMI